MNVYSAVITWGSGENEEGNGVVVFMLKIFKSNDLSCQPEMVEWVWVFIYCVQILSALWLVECPPAKSLCFTMFYNQMWSVVSVNGRDWTYGEEKLYCIGSEPGHSTGSTWLISSVVRNVSLTSVIWTTLTLSVNPLGRFQAIILNKNIMLY